jgi:serine/threonine protein kinase
VLRELLLGLDYLHSGRCSGKPTIHRDLKAANVYELTPFSSSFSSSSQT